MQSKRVLGRSMARELSRDETDAVSGGRTWFSGFGIPGDPHSGILDSDQPPPPREVAPREPGPDKPMTPILD
jgi:hypothetical protein